MSNWRYDYPHTRNQDSDLTEILKTFRLLASDYESLLARLQSLEDEIANIDDYIDAQLQIIFDAYKQVIDAQLSLMQQQITSLESQFYALSDTVQSQLDGMLVIINNNYTILDGKISTLKSYVDTQNAMQDMITDQKIAYLQQQINDLHFDLPPIFNPVTGLKEGIEKTVNDVYNVLRVHAFTALEFDCAWWVTCDYYDNMGLSALDYDVDGKFLLEWWGYLHHMVNPYNGNWDRISYVVATNASRSVTVNFTADDYDLREYTADAYDAIGIDAYEYDFNASAYLH